MRYLNFWIALVLASLLTAPPLAAQTGWQRLQSDYGATYQSERSQSMVYVLLLWEIDQKAGTKLAMQPDSASESIIEKALNLQPFKVEQIVAEDLSNQRMPKITGYATTPRGRQAFAATLANRGNSRRLVMIFDDPAKIDKMGRRVGSVSNFGSSIAAADRAGWVPGQTPTRPNSATRQARTASNIQATTNRQAVSQPKTIRRSKYTLPTDQSDFDKWPLTGKITRSPNARDPLAPRGYSAVTGPKFNVSTFDGALRDLAKDAKITMTGKPFYEDLNAWKLFDGRQSKLVMVTTTRGGEKGVLMAYIVKPKTSSEFSILAYEVPEQTFLEGGGIVRMMLIRGIIPSTGVFQKGQVDKIARAPFKQQMAFYEAALDKLYERKSREFIASQSAVTLRMMELNYDLLLGGDISSPFIAD